MKTKSEQTIWDVIVVGGGPAGMMAAGRAGTLGNKVLLLEKNDHLGKKLRITGGGRCNLTNGELDLRTFLSHFKEDDKFLFSAFSQYGVKETLEFFHSHNMKTKMEDRKRIFPESNSSESVREVCLQYLKEGNVTVKLSSTVKKIHTNKHTVTSVELIDGTCLSTKTLIIATGGTSHPETGSTGDGFLWLKDLGHKIQTPTDSLVPIVIREPWVKRLQGITLPNAKVTVFQNGKKQNIIKKETEALKKNGRVLFTHFGITGPLILNISSQIEKLLQNADVTIHLDMVPDLGHDVLNKTLQDILTKENSKKIKNSLSAFGVVGIILEVLALAQVDPNTINHHLTREMRLRIVDTLKAFPLTVKGLLGSDKAIVTNGGVSLKEVDMKTMRSKLFANVFLVGDILHIDRPSGGFSLQLCWTTGFVAGTNAGEKK